MLDDTLTTATPDLATTPWRADAAATPRQLAALVLFTGAACRPGPAVCESLAREGMRCLWLAGREQALQAARAAQFDAVVIDASSLPERGGAALAQLRAAVRCPVVMLADRGDEIDEILALELGADAYLQHPVAPRRLRAHLSVLIRWRHCAHAEDSLVDTPSVVDGLWHVDRVGNRLVRGSVRVALTEVQSAFLQCLFEAEGRIVPRSRLAAALPNGQPVHARSIDVYIYRLRKHLHGAGVFDLLIETIRGRGYVLRFLKETPGRSQVSLTPSGGLMRSGRSGGAQ
jgi:two-component system, OmpR family, response regulator